MKFRKKPIVIEAIQWNGCKKEYGEIISILRIPTTQICMYIGDDLYLEIETLEGNHRAYPSDWIIKGIAGEFYPCKPAIFEKSYEKVIE